MSRDSSNNLTPSTSPLVFSVEGFTLQAIKALATAIGTEIITKHGKEAVGAAVDFMTHHARKLLVDDKTNLPEIFQATIRGNHTQMFELMDSGIDINQRDRTGKTALFYVRDKKSVSALIFGGNIDVNLVDDYGQTATQYFASRDETKYLADYITDLNTFLNTQNSWPDEQNHSPTKVLTITGIVMGSMILSLSTCAIIKRCRNCRNNRVEDERRNDPEDPINQMLADVYLEELEEAAMLRDIAMERGIDLETLPQEELSSLLDEIRYPREEVEEKEDSSNRKKPENSIGTLNIETINVAPSSNNNGKGKSNH